MMTVIIADDEPHFREYMQNALDWEAAGFEIRGVCKDGEEVLEAVAQKMPDIALLDINMPGLDGIGAARQLKQLAPEIHLVFVTGCSEFEYARKAVQIGVEEYLLKPFSQEELAEVLEKLKKKIQKEQELRRSQEESKESRKIHQRRTELCERLMRCFRTQDEAGIAEVLEAAGERILSGSYALENSYRVIGDLLSVCFSYIAEMKGEVSEIFGEDFSPYTRAYALESVDEKIQYLSEIFGKTVRQFRPSYSKRGMEIMEAVEAYIGEHYWDCELTVEQISEAMYLDSSYVRRVVSRQRGCTLSELITETRMREAQKRMEETEMTISQIAEAVGYAETSYFSKCFKKYFGVSPKQYVNQFSRKN